MSKRDRSSKYLDDKPPRSSETRRSRTFSEADGPSAGRAQGITAEDLKITIENIISITRREDGPDLDKESVISMLTGLYNWFTFDRNQTIPLPRSSTKYGVSHMWPHGAVVNTRRQGEPAPDYDDRRLLRDINDDDFKCVSRSVVSSSHGGDIGSSHRGRILREDSISSFQSSDGPHYSPTSPRQPNVFQYQERVVPSVSEVPRSVDAMREVRQLKSPGSTKPRYSIMGALNEVDTLKETPTPSLVTKVRRVVRRPKVATTARPAGVSADEGEAVIFADG